MGSKHPFQSCFSTRAGLKALLPLVVLTSSLILFTSLLTSSCSPELRDSAFSSRPQQSDQEGRIVVATTIPPIADIVSKVGGNKVEVLCLLPPGASPHTFEPTAEQMRKAARANVVFKIGLGFDDWADKIVSSSSRKPLVYLLDGGIDLLLNGGGPNPHIWLSLRNGSIICRTIASSLSQFDSKNGPSYQANAKAYSEKLEAADLRFQSLLAASSNKKMVQLHAAWDYFARDYGVDIVATIEPTPGREPTPQSIAELKKKIQQNHLKVIFTEPQLPDKTVQFLAEELGLKIEVLDPIGGSGELRDYLRLLEYNFEKISRSFQDTR